MTSKPHDAVFKAAFERPEHAAALFRSVLPASIVASIAWPSLAGEAGSFVDVELADRHSDLLFSVDMQGGRAFLYLLLEHQSANDPDMPLRMLVYQVRIWERHRKQHAGPLPPILPVVVSLAPGGWTAPRSFHELFAPAPATIPELASFVPSFDLLIEDLAHVSNEDLKARALAAFPKLALWLLRDARNREQLLRNLGVWGDAFAEALHTPRGLESVSVLLRYIALITNDLHLAEFRAKILEAAPEVERAAMTIAEQLIAEGLAKGRVEGRVETLTRQLECKFGALDPAILTRVARADASEVDVWLERVLFAATLDEVLAPRQ